MSSRNPFWDRQSVGTLSACLGKRLTWEANKVQVWVEDFQMQVGSCFTMIDLGSYQRTHTHTDLTNHETDLP